MIIQFNSSANRNRRLNSDFSKDKIMHATFPSHEPIVHLKTSVQSLWTEASAKWLHVQRGSLWQWMNICLRVRLIFQPAVTFTQFPLGFKGFGQISLNVPVLKQVNLYIISAIYYRCLLITIRENNFNSFLNRFVKTKQYNAFIVARLIFIWRDIAELTLNKH